MTWQTSLLAVAVILWAAIQYGLAVHALRDLSRRPRVRGNNKVVWALVILGVPIAGALVYSVYGPTSFLRRDRPRMTHPEPLVHPVARVDLPTLADDDPILVDIPPAEPPPSPRRPRASGARDVASRGRSAIPARDEQSGDASHVHDNTPAHPSAPTVRDHGGRR